MHPRLHLLLKLTGVVAALVVLVPAAFLAYISLSADTSPASIEKYQIDVFSEHATVPFFYSIGDELRYSDRIDATSRVLFKGKPHSVIPSPDAKYALVVSEGVLWIVNSVGTPPLRITPVADYSPAQKTIGQEYYRNRSFQWAADSARFYLIKDRYYETRGAQLFSIHGELTEYDLASRQLRKVFSPFRAYRYFLADEGTFFGEANDEGDVILTVQQGESAMPVSEISRNEFRVNDKVTPFRKVPFYTFTINEYAKDIFSSVGLVVEVERDDHNLPIGHLIFKGKRLLSIRQGMGIKGPLDGYRSIHSAFLPGERYFLLNVFTGTFSGQLLIDTDTGQYKTLPKDTRVYRNINTHNFSDWVISMDGVKVDLTREERSKRSW